MKTAISIPTPIFNTAKQVAKELRLSRSELYTKAIKEFLENPREGLFLVDSGAIDSLVPKDRLESVGIEHKIQGIRNLRGCQPHGLRNSNPKYK